MNLFKRAIGGDSAGVQVKAQTRTFTEVENLLYRALYSWYGKDQPIAVSDTGVSYIKHGYAKNSDLYSIVRYIITKAGDIPFYVEVQRNKSDEWERAEEHDVQGLLKQPNSYTTGGELITADIGFELITGNSYIYGITPEFGVNKSRTQEMHVLPSHFTQIVYGDFFDPVRAYRLMFAPYKNDDIPKEQVCHFKFWNPDYDASGNGLYGMSPVKAAATLLRQSNDTFLAQAKSLENMGPPIAIGGEGEGWTPEQAKLLRETYVDEYTGPHNSRIPLFAGNKLMAIQLGLSPIDLKILEAQILSFEQLCRVYQFPTPLLDSKSSTLDNRRVAEKSLYTDVVLPLLWKRAEKFTTWLNPQYKENIRICVDTSDIEVLQEDKKEMVTWLKDAYWIPTQEKQRMLGVEIDDTLPQYFIPANIVPWGEEFAANDTLVDSEEKMRKLGLI